MKTESIYLTVRVDISFDDSMDAKEAIQTAFANLDYDFKMPAGYGIDVDDMEICGMNKNFE